MAKEKSSDVKRIKVEYFSLTNTAQILFVTIVSLLFLCAIDALLTLFLVNNRAKEANPVMTILLNIGPYAVFD
jgi:hypothetical protein